MWVCPLCEREFRNTHQQHTCRLINKDDLFAKRPPNLKILYEKVKAFVQTLGDFREETVLPDVIFFKRKSTFLAVKVKKDHLDIQFFLDHIAPDPPVSKYLQTSKRRVTHIVPIDEMADLNAQLKRWMKQSFELIEGK